MRILLVVALLLLVGVGAFYAVREAGARGEEFPVARYLESPMDLVGNRYALVGAVRDQLAADPSTGRVLVIKTADGDSLPIVVPSELGGNPSFQQRYVFDVWVDENAALIAERMQKK